MKRWLPLLLLCPLVFAQVKVAGPSKIAGPEKVVPGGGVDNQIGPVDAYLDCNTSSPGTVLTTGILNLCTLGNTGGGFALTASSGMTVGAHQSGCGLGGSVQVNGKVYPIEHFSQSIDYDNSLNFKVATLTVPNANSTTASGYTVVDYLGCVTFGVATGIGQLFDMIRIDYIDSTPAAHFSVFQLNNGGCSGAYGVNMETDSPSNPTHSACITLVPGTTYWVSLHVDLLNSASGTVMRVYDTSFNQVGSTVTTSNAIGIELQGIRIGNNEVGTSTGHNFFENQLVRYSADFATPLGPRSTTQPSVYFISSNPNTTSLSGASTTTATPATTLPAGVTNFVWVGYENAAGTTSGCVDTAGNTYTQSATVTLATQGHGDIWAAKNTIANAANVVTCTHTSSTFRTIDAVAIGGASLTSPVDVTATGTAAAGNADVTTGSFTPTTSTGAVLVCGYITAGAALGPGTNYQLVYQSATTSQACEMRSAAPNSSQTATLKQTNTSSKWAVAVAIKQ